MNAFANQIPVGNFQIEAHAESRHKPVASTMPRRNRVAASLHVHVGECARYLCLVGRTCALMASSLSASVPHARCPTKLSVIYRIHYKTQRRFQISLASFQAHLIPILPDGLKCASHDGSVRLFFLTAQKEMANRTSVIHMVNSDVTVLTAPDWSYGDGVAQ